MGHKLRVACRVVAALFAVLIVLVIALPAWFPWVLRPTLSKYGVHFDRFERQGYGRFAMGRMRWENSSGSFQADKVEGFQPTAWLWHLYFGGPNAAACLRIEHWRFETNPTATKGRHPPRGGGPDSLCNILDRMRSKLPSVRAWLPSAQLTNGVLVIGSRSFTMPSIEWRRGRLSATAKEGDWAQTISLDCDLSRDAEFILSAAANPLDLKTDLLLTEE